MRFSKPTMFSILAAIIIGFFGLFVHQSKIAIYNKEKAKKLENTLSNETNTAKISQLKLSDSLTVMQAQTEDLQLTIKNLKARYSDLLKASDIKPKYVDRIMRVETVTHSVDTVICQVDSFGGLSAGLHDGYADILVNIDSTRKATIDYTVKDSLTIINYTKKHSILFGLFKWNSYQGSKVITHNPKATPAMIVVNNIIK